MMFGEKESGADTSSTSADAAENEWPAEPVVGVARHPFVAIAKDRKDYHSQASADACCKEKVGSDLEKTWNR